MRFRTDLEGLRGVAVTLVVLFHFDLGLPGGFVGVDAFFVLSGFLITTILLRELVTTGGLDLAAFYARRARRILPAAAVALVLALIACMFVIAPLDQPGVAIDATACGLFVCNVTFALHATDYFAAAAPSPFLHYWSLGVEEQFYLGWPLFLVFAFRVHRPMLLTTLLCVASLGCAVGLTMFMPPWAFFALPSRAWQLGAGALLALNMPSLERAPAAAMHACGLAGVALLGAVALTIDPSVAYPGIAAVAPTAAVLATIAAGVRGGVAARILGLSPLRLLGRISYSLYLYHWPVFVLAENVSPGLDATARIGLVGVAIALAAVSRAVVEEPFVGRGLRIGARRGSFGLAIATTALVIVTAQFVTVSAASSLEQGLPTPRAAAATDSIDPPSPDPAIVVGTASPQTSTTATPQATPGEPMRPLATTTAPREIRPRLADARADTDRVNERGCGLSLAGDTPPACVLGDAAGTVTVALVGDSHAAQWAPALEAIAASHGWRLVPFTKDSCIFLDLRIVSIHLEREYNECERWRTKVVAAILALHPDLVVVSSSRWLHPVDPADADPERQAHAMARLVERLDARVALIADTPLMSQDVPACLSRRGASCDTSRDYALTGHLARDGRAAELLGATLIDPSVWICDDSVCPAIVDQTIVYRDDHHLTATMARALAPLVEPGLLDALR